MILTTLLLSFCQAATADSAAQLTPKEALALAFPECKIERVVHYPDKKQKTLAEKLAGRKIATKTVRAYRATKKGKLVGTGYFDTHKVRTKGQTLFLVVDADSKIARIEVLRFNEPPEYKPKAKWFAQFKGKRLGKKLQIKQDIRGLTGATLSARATTQAVRRVLALHEVFYPRPKVAAKVAPGKKTKDAVKAKPTDKAKSDG